MRCAANGTDQIDATPATDRTLAIRSGREQQTCLISYAYVYVPVDFGSESVSPSSLARQLAAGIKYLRARSLADSTLAEAARGHRRSLSNR